MASLNRVEHTPGCLNSLMWPDATSHTVGLGTAEVRRRFVCETCGASSAWFPVLGWSKAKPKRVRERKGGVVVSELKDAGAEAQRLLGEAEVELKKGEPDMRRYKELCELAWAWTRLMDPGRS